MIEIMSFQSFELDDRCTLWCARPGWSPVLARGWSAFCGEIAKWTLDDSYTLFVFMLFSNLMLETLVFTGFDDFGGLFIAFANK